MLLIKVYHKRPPKAGGLLFTACLGRNYIQYRKYAILKSRRNSANRVGVFFRFMNPNNSMQGDLSALRQLMGEQGIGTGVLDQQTAGAPGARPNVLPTPGMPQGAAMPQGMPQAQVPGAPAPQGGGMPAESNEAQTIIKALGARLATISKMDSAPLQQSAPAPMPTGGV